MPAAYREQIRAGGDLQTGCDYHQGPHPVLAALFRRVQDRLGGHRDHRQVHRLGQVEHRGQTPFAAYLPGPRVDRVHPGGVTAGPDGLQDRPALRSRSATAFR
jgi:hypothetical protein